MRRILHFAALAALLTTAFGQAVSTQTPRVYAINYNPWLEAFNQRLHSKCGWNNPATLNSSYIVDMRNSSHGILNYRLSGSVDVDEFPLKSDGFRYTDESYIACWQTWSGWHSPDGVDYGMIARNFDLARRVDFGEIDEVFIQGAPYFGYWESTMAGYGGYWCNSGPQQRIASARIFVMMGFNFERGVDCMLEDYGHRTESIMRLVYGSWQPVKTHMWNRFTLYDKQLPGEAGCGNVHYAPNSQSDYDWGNPTYVWSYCDDFLYNYPNLTGQKKWVNCAEWGGGDMRLHHIWWFKHIPHVEGSLTEYNMTRLNNWWEYLQNFNSYTESGGNHVPGGTPPNSQPYPNQPTYIARAGDDWRPQINRNNRIVWSGHDGMDTEIFSANADGTGFVQITSNSQADELPQINNSGKIVWQSFDGRDFEIYTANADGTEVRRITDNAVQDLHPAISDAGRIVWEQFDGTDYEIYSANADGSNLVRITNRTGSGKPLDDMWPRINASNRVVWMGFDGSRWQIFSANADGTGLVNITNNTYDSEYPQISDTGKVVWQTWRSDSNCEIYAADATGANVTRLTNNSVQDWWPQVNSSGTVVWMQMNASNRWQIRRGTVDSTSSTALTSSTTHNQHPKIDDDGRIVWQGYDGSRWQIYQYKDGVISKVSSYDYDNKAPAIATGSYIVWHGERDTSSAGPTTDIHAAAPPFLIRGKVTLGHYAASPMGVTVRFTVREEQSGTLITERDIPLDAQGKYAFSCPFTGNVRVSAEGTHWLRQSQVVTLDAAGLELDFTLINGDALKDGSVDTGDLNRLFIEWAMSSAAADLDGSGWVDLGDLNIVLVNFGLQSDP